MKKLLLIIIGLILFSCTNTEEVTVTPVEIDSVLVKSQQSLVISDSVQKMSDSTTKEQVVKIVKEFQVLYNEVEKYKTERLELLKQTQTVTEKIIVRVDTVYIETKKNFWGKEKTSTKVKSDSVVTELVDSSVIESQKIDTLQENFF